VDGFLQLVYELIFYRALDAGENDRRQDSEQDSDRESYKEDEILRLDSKKRQSNSPPNPRGRFTLVKPPRNAHKLEPTIDLWSESATSLDRPQPPAASAAAKPPPNTWRMGGDGSVKKVKNETTKPTLIESVKEPPHDVSLSSEYNPAVVAYISSDDRPSNPNSLAESGTEKQKLKPPKRNAKSSTIFRSSARTSITITLTAPDDEVLADSDSHQRNSFNDIRNIRNSSTPLPPTKPLSKAPRNNLAVQSIDRSRLMPPTEHVLDARRIQKAHEFREVRGFMINFMNMKGAMFPEQLRFQMMDLYGIEEGDLHPETVAKFNSKDSVLEHYQDEGVALEDMGNSKQHLKILETAFRSRMEEVTPKKKNVPIPAGRPQSTPRQRMGSGKPNLQSRSETAIATFVDDDNMPLAWLAPLISTSPSDLAPLPHSLTKTRSTPNLSEHAVQHQRNTTSSNPGTPTEERQKQFQEDSQTRARRSNRLSGAFGVMREAMLGRKRSKASK